MWSPRATQVERLLTIGLVVLLGATALPSKANAGPANAGPASAGPASAGPADTGPADAAPATVRISVNSAGMPGDAPSDGASVSADGRYVTFASAATNLVPGDSNGYTDIFVRDRVAGTIERVSVSSTGAQANGGSHPLARISADGRYISFASTATNLDPAASTGGVIQVYLRDRATQTTRRVSVSSHGTVGDGHSFGAAVSGNGRYVAFGSYATNLVGGDTNDRSDVFIRDVRLGTTRLVSVAQDGHTRGDGSSSFPMVSSNGRYVAFLSDATNLQANGTMGDSNAYVKDLRNGAVQLVSVTAGGRPRGTSDMSMSADGRLIAFAAHQPGSQVYVRDRTAGTTVVASLGFDGSLSDGPSSSVSISADGRYVAFVSAAGNLVPGSLPGSVFVRDLRRARTIVGGVASSGAYIDGAQWQPAMSNTGVAFNTLARDVAPGGDDRHPYQVYFHQF